MEMRFQILGSSSAGNCALLTTADCKILIDAGFSARKIAQKLDSVGESLDSIDAVFLTHEHGDHSAGVRGMAKRRNIQVFANRDTAQAVQSKLNGSRPAWQIFETDSVFDYRGLRVTPFSVPHDAYDPVGFVFECGDGSLFAPHRSVAWLTDLGHLPRLAREKVRHADVLVLEANHDSELLENDSKRPWSVKQRIRGRHGHLSNKAAFELLVEEAHTGWKHVYLAHLSRDCNSTELVERTFAPLRESGKRYRVDVVDPHNGTCPALDLIGLA